MSTADTARLLRRLTMSPTPERVERFGDAAPAEVVDALLADGPLDVTPPTLTDDDDWAAGPTWWMSVMRRADAGLHERMIWFWHGHLTSGMEKAGPQAMLIQHVLLRRHALGNFKTLLKEITLDPAMLLWLDGAGSEVESPNENYGRELMELFTLGRDSGAYTESDVRAAAKALAGYWVDDEADHRVVFEPEAALRRPIAFLDQSARDVDDVIDVICDQPACARFIARKLHVEFVLAEPRGERLDELADLFRSSGYEIRPLVEAILRHPTFLESTATRPRSALEWHLAFERLIGAELDVWNLEEMGQMPLDPPNVAGWPDPTRWRSTGMLLAKAQTALDNAWDTETLDAADPVGDILRRAVLHDVSDATRTALDDIERSIEGRRELSSLLHAAVAMCPEFSIS